MLSVSFLEFIKKGTKAVREAWTEIYRKGFLRKFAVLESTKRPLGFSNCTSYFTIQLFHFNYDHSSIRFPSIYPSDHSYIHITIIHQDNPLQLVLEPWILTNLASFQILTKIAKKNFFPSLTHGWDVASPNQQQEATLKKARRERNAYKQNELSKIYR
jgi:hypothetical protein